MFLLRLLNYIFGYHIFECNARDTEKCLNLFMRYRIIYWDLERREQMTRFSVLSKDARAVFSLCERSEIELCLVRICGMFHTVKKYKKRIGVFFGLAVIAFAVWFSGLFVWKIDVVGNDSVSSSYVTELLLENGLGVGSYIPALELDMIRERALISSDKLSWMALNVKGTGIEVVVREIEEGKRTDTTPANLVAERDGVIELLEVHKGRSTVNVGDAVRAGELLVSGILSDEKTGTRYVHASGKVFARTTKNIRIEIPFEYEEKTYTGEQKTKKTLKFFNKTVNLFSNCRNLYENYDKIEREVPLSFFGRFTVPVSLLVSEFSEYTYSTKNRTETEAVKLAYATLALRMEEALSDAELVKKTLSARFEGGAYVVECELVLVENIAKEASFEIN